MYFCLTHIHFCLIDTDFGLTRNKVLFTTEMQHKTENIDDIYFQTSIFCFPAKNIILAATLPELIASKFWISRLANLSLVKVLSVDGQILHFNLILKFFNFSLFRCNILIYTCNSTELWRLGINHLAIWPYLHSRFTVLSQRLLSFDSSLEK